MNLNIDINNHFEQKCQFENKYEQPIWTEIWTIILIKKMNNHFEQKYEESNWTKLWTVNLSRKSDLNNFITNQFGQKYHQLF